jgi:hypothetical protein
VLTVKVLTNETELSDGLTLMQPRLYVFRSGNTLSYVPLEPNPLGYKARLVFTDWGTETVEIDNFERLSVALWNYADMLDEPEQLFNDAEQLYKAGF